MRRVLNLALLVACGGDARDSKRDTDTSGPSPDDTATDTGPPAPPCATGAWGALSDPADAVHVRADGDDAADGSADRPFATFDVALTATRADGGLRTIFLGPGTFPVSASLETLTAEGASDDGLAVLGCPGETTLEAADDALPVVKISGVQGLLLADLTLSGGLRTVQVWQAAVATLERVTIVGGRRAGMVGDGGCDLTLDEVEVREVLADDDGSFGYGISVRESALSMTGGGVWDATGVGILAHFSTTVLADVTVSGTQVAADGSLGRGIQVQESGEATITGGTYEDNADAGLFALRVDTFDVAGAYISRTLATPLADGSDSTGDGIVVTRGDSLTDPTWFWTSVSGATVEDSERAGMVFDGVEVRGLDGNALTGAGAASGSVYVQGGAVVTSATDPWVDVTSDGLPAFGLAVTPLEVDELDG
ncbi:MAG: right-handed parallel beta-helix repeat-containing protein [Myxococcota bacterium]